MTVFLVLYRPLDCLLAERTAEPKLCALGQRHVENSELGQGSTSYKGGGKGGVVRGTVIAHRCAIAKSSST